MIRLGTLAVQALGTNMIINIDVGFTGRLFLTLIKAAY